MSWFLSSIKGICLFSLAIGIKFWDDVGTGIPFILGAMFVFTIMDLIQHSENLPNQNEVKE